MTSPFVRVGDFGQRYAMQVFGWPNADSDEWQTFGYSRTEPDFDQVSRTLMTHPSITRVRLLDRNTGNVIGETQD